MCRFLAYSGTPTFLADYVCAPTHSLVQQSRHAHEAKAEINADGFGLGWYDARPEPGLYREIRPAWSDENLGSLCRQVRAGLFFAHVRASTGTASTRANCHPFAQGRHLFMHNGQIGGYGRLKRRVEALIPDELYDSRLGTGDSEAIFLAALGAGLAEDPVGAMARTIRRLDGLMQEAAIGEPLRFTAALSDGETIYAFRWASDVHAPSLYHRQVEGGLVVVSEPYDGSRADWREVPKNCVLVAAPGGPAEITCFDSELARAA